MKHMQRKHVNGWDNRTEETFCRPTFGRKHYQVVQGRKDTTRRMAEMLDVSVKDNISKIG